MATTEIPPTRPRTHEDELHDVPVLLVQLQDDLARARLREAFWISLVFHLVVIIALGTSPKWLAMSKPIRVATADQLIRGRELTYLDLPHDRQIPPQKPPADAKHLSDKNRIAMARHPRLDKKTLDELLDARRPGPPGPSGSPGMTAPRPMPPAAQGSPRQPLHPSPSESQTQARLEPPRLTPEQAFGQRAMSAGAAIQQATRAAAAGRAAGYGGAGGDYGFGSVPNTRVMGNMDILSDTMGVDFGPYLSRVLHAVRLNWYNLIPEEARAPLMKKGKVAIEFAILKNGQVAGMKLVGPSGDISLDRAAWGGITGSNPFPPLPPEFRGQYLALRFHFYYNPSKEDLE